MRVLLLFCTLFSALILCQSPNQRLVLDTQGNRGVKLSNLYKGSGNTWIGDRNTILGKDNSVLGYDNKVLGTTNVIKGLVNTIDGQGNTVEGQQNTIKGQQNLVVGSGNVVTTNIEGLDSGLESRLPAWMKSTPLTQSFQKELSYSLPTAQQSSISAPSVPGLQAYRLPVNTPPKAQAKSSAISYQSFSKSPCVHRGSCDPNPSTVRALPSNRNNDLRSKIQSQVRAKLQESFRKAGIIK